jgi:hypothetical protein
MNLRRALLVLLCSISAPLAAQQVTITGTVRDSATTRPLHGALVTIGTGMDQRVTRTDERGAFRFPAVTVGVNDFAVRRLGYAAWSRAIAVKAGVPLDIMLHSTRTLDTIRVSAARLGIWGVVADARDMRPIPGAVVQIIGDSLITADASGAFFAPVKSAGSYAIRARAEGHRPLLMSVAMPKDDGVEVTLLLDSAGRGDKADEAAFADFQTRILRARLSSVFIPRSELTRGGGDKLVDAIRGAPSFLRKALRLGETACVFFEGRPMPGTSLGHLEVQNVEAVELYTEAADGSRTLAGDWPRGFPCADTGMPRVHTVRDVIRWIVIWRR